MQRSTPPYNKVLFEEIRRNPGSRIALLRETVNIIFCEGDVKSGRLLLRDYIDMTIGFTLLGAKLRIPPKCLMLMFGPKGVLKSNQLFAVICGLQRHVGAKFHIPAEATIPRSNHESYNFRRMRFLPLRRVRQHLSQ